MFTFFCVIRYYLTKKKNASSSERVAMAEAFPIQFIACPMNLHDPLSNDP
jgi:hypothetical protein